MLVAPILFPIMGLSMGIVMVDSKLIWRSIKTLLQSMGLAIFAATIVTLFTASQEYGLTNEVLARTEVSLAYAAISIIAGLAASFALINPKLNESLPGIAISVALIPPLAVIGIGIAYLNWYVISKALLLFLINIGGILFASMLVFTLMNLYVRRKVAQVSIAKDEKEIEEIKAKAKEAKIEKAKSKKQKIVVKTKTEGENDLESSYHLELDLRDVAKQDAKKSEKFVVNSVDK